MRTIIVLCILLVCISATAANVRFAMLDIDGSPQTNNLKITKIGDVTVAGRYLESGIVSNYNLELIY